ncbi:MAG: sigma-70 family RNA polymerase sigma factor, partial [Chloroflexia bacterium]
MEQTLPTTDLVWRDLSGGIREFILRRIGGDDDSADDILQDVFLKVHTRIDTLKNQDRLESWIYQIVRNTINDYFRSQRPQSEVPDELAAPEPEVPDLAQQLIPSV